MQAMREEALAQVEPDPLDGIELGAAGGQRQQRDGVGHNELRREVPAGPVEEKNGVRAGRQLLREGGQEHGHGFGGRTRQRQREGLVRARAAGGEEVHAIVALIGDPRRAHAALVPAMADPALLPDPGLVFTPELDLDLRMRRGDGRELCAKLLF
jgi:hypothetical protein